MTTEQAERIAHSAARLESLLGACSGVGDEYPLDIIARDEAAANILALELSIIKQQIKEAGIGLRFNPAHLQNPELEPWTKRRKEKP